MCASEQTLLLLAHPHQLLAGAFDMGTDPVGFALQLMERLLDLEEGLEPVLEAERQLDLAADLLERGAGLLGVLEHGGDLRLGPALALRQLLRTPVERLVVRRELHHGGEALLQLRDAGAHRVHVASRLRDRLAEPLQPLGRGAGVLDQPLVTPAFLLHLAQDGAHLLGEFPVLGAIPEQTIEQRGHRKLLRSAIRRSRGDRRFIDVTA